MKLAELRQIFMAFQRANCALMNCHTDCFNTYWQGYLKEATWCLSMAHLLGLFDCYFWIEKAKMVVVTFNNYFPLINLCIGDLIVL